MMRRWGIWSLVVWCVAASSVACDDEPEVTEASSGGVPADDTEEPAADDEGSAAAPEADALDGELTGTIDGEPFVARGVLAQRLREGEPVEIRVLSRPASCESFEADYESREGEPVVVMYLEWPKPEGDRVSFGAQEVHERIQFCKGNDRGRASCEPRAQDQGSLTVLEASPEGGALSFDVSSPEGSLSGRLEFTICER